MGRSQADSKEAIHTLMEDREFISSSRGTENWVITREARGGKEAAHEASPPMNEREHSDGVGETRVEDTKKEWNSCKEQAGQEISEHPIGAENTGDSVGYTKVIVEELDPEAMPLMAPYL